MPFGLRNAGQTFQRMMDQILGDLPYAFVYVDDILVFSPNLESHVSDLRDILQICREHGLTISLPKCEFAVPQLEFLGHSVSAQGLAPLKKHTSALQDFPVPTNQSGLQRFLGLINYYRKFIKNAAQLLAPLTNALKGPKGSKKGLVWSQEMQTALSAAKAMLLAVPTLIHPVPGVPVSLAVDASDSHVGAVLQQQVQGSWAPMAFFSRKLTAAEAKYSAFDRELLAAYSAIRHFRFLLEGRDFELFTDHKPLTTALFRTSPPWSARQQRHLAFISEFTSKLTHLPGSENTVADALSRPIPQSSNSLIAPLDSTAPSRLPSDVSWTVPKDVENLPTFKKFAEAQNTCPDVKRMTTFTSLSIVSVPIHDVQILCDVSTGSPRPLVPTSLRLEVFQSLHQISHPGIRASRRLISSRFVWKFMSKDISKWTRSCMLCQRNKISTHVQTPITHIPVPTRRFAHIHVDLVGPLPPSLGFTHLLTMIDRTSRWPEAVPINSTSAETCARVFIETWISRFGVPSTLTSDRGAQFTSSLWSRVCGLLGIDHVLTTSYHPQSNGMVERFHRSLKTALRSQQNPSSWASNLSMVLLGLRTIPKEDTGSSPSEAVFGTQLCLPGEFLTSGDMSQSDFIRRIDIAVSNFSSSVPHHRSVPLRFPSALSTSKFVFVREDAVKPPLSPLYRGPYLVLERTDKYFKLQIGDETDTVSVDRLKPAFSTDEMIPAMPPRRGRPRIQPPVQPATTSPATPDHATKVPARPAPTRIQPSRTVKSVHFRPQPQRPQ